ncbi:MAG: zf-HC2 domain-containing protein [Calditrichaeota bacterium]|nr:MAG: zf-HC2 domain-containing protein [Calditrichota bacterium]
MKHVKGNTELYLALRSGALGAWERQQLEAHLAGCQSCRHYVEKLDRIFDEVDLSIFPELELPAWSPGRATSPIPGPNQSRTTWRWTVGLVVQRLALAILLVAAIVLGTFLGRWVAQPVNKYQRNDLLTRYQQIFEPGDISEALAVVLENKPTVAP